MDDELTTLCRACREEIKEGASICPHCGSAQTPQKWHALGQLLKWVGGVTAVLSLVAGSLQLSDLYQDWRKKQRIATNYVAAARLQFNTGELANASALLEKAEAIDPINEDLKIFRIDLVMNKLQQYIETTPVADWVMTCRLYKDERGRVQYDWTNLTTKRDYLRKFFDAQNALATLALGAVGAKGARKAEILAHMAWLDILVYKQRDEHDLESLFAQAFDADPGNAYARLMYAGWLMQDNNRIRDPNGQLAAAVEQLRLARPDDTQRFWFNALSTVILGFADDMTQAKLEQVKNVARMDPADVTPFIAKEAMNTLAHLVFSLDKNPTTDSQQNPLMEAFKLKDLIGLAERLGRILFDCDPWQYSCNPKGNVSGPINFFDNVAFLYEQAGQVKKANQAYLMAWLARRRANYDSDSANLDSIERTLEATGTPATRVPIFVDEGYGGLEYGDLVTQVKGTPVHEISDIRANIDLDDDEIQYAVTVIRDGKSIEMNLEGRVLIYGRFLNYVAPKSLLEQGVAPGFFNDFQAAWSSVDR